MSQPYTGSIKAVLTQLKASRCRLVSGQLFNSNSAVAYCQVFDALAANVVLGTTPPTLSFGIPIGGESDLGDLVDLGYEFVNGLTIAMTTTRSGNSAPTNSVDYNFEIE